jgi:hypothetical protein
MRNDHVIIATVIVVRLPHSRGRVADISAVKVANFRRKAIQAGINLVQRSVSVGRETGTTVATRGADERDRGSRASSRIGGSSD